MADMQAAVKMTPFWGAYIWNPTLYGSVKKDAEMEQKEKEKLKLLYEMVDDYVEQA